ncbi:hypothetical protein ACWGIU_01915 [Streptomyces sp. NPDC054840]
MKCAYIGSVASYAPELEEQLLGRYSFSLPDPPGGLRPLRDADAVDEE